MAILKQAVSSFILVAFLLGVGVPLANAQELPANITDLNSKDSVEITSVEKTPRGIISSQNTKDQMSMNGRHYITVSWEKDPQGLVTITGIVDAWTTDGYFDLIDTYYLDAEATAYFWDDFHKAYDHITIYASEI